GPPLAALALVLTANPPLDLGPPRQPPPATGGCPAGARVEVNLAAWKASLEQAKTPKRRDELLADVKLSLDPPGNEATDASDAPAAPEPRLAAIDDQAVQLEAGQRLHHVLQLHYKVDGEELPTIDLVQVLRPLGDRAYCALGSELSRRGDAA